MAQRWGQTVCPPLSSPLGPPARIWLVTFRPRPTCRSVPPPGWVASGMVAASPGPRLQHVAKPPRGSCAASFGPHALRSGKGLGVFVERGFVSFYFGLSSVCLFIQTRYLKGQAMAEGVMCSLFVHYFGEAFALDGKWNHGFTRLVAHSPLALSLRSSTYCFSFQICDCTNSFHMKEFSLFK